MTIVLRTYADQDQAQSDLLNYVEKNQQASLKQALNQAYDGDGKNSGNHPVVGYGTVQVLHASAGKAGTDASVTLFYFFSGGTFCLIAFGQHEDPGYRIDKTLGQDQPPFQKGKLVGPTGG